MVLLKQTPTQEGTAFVFSHYQDAYKKAQRIEKLTGFHQNAQRTSEGFTIIEPKGTPSRANRTRQPRQQTTQPQQEQYQQEQYQQEQYSPEPQIPENLGYEAPPRPPPGLYDNNW
jgi:hypothetical protein